MPSENDSVEIVACLGSSCYVRGNYENLVLLKKYVQAHGCDVSLRLTGCFCQDLCKQGPNVMIGGKLYYGVTEERLGKLLQQLDRGDHDTA